MTPQERAVIEAAKKWDDAMRHFAFRSIGRNERDAAASELKQAVSALRQAERKELAG